MERNDTRDAILVGLFFLSYGILSWLAAGKHVPTLRGFDLSTIDANRLAFARSRRAEMIEQEMRDA